MVKGRAGQVAVCPHGGATGLCGELFTVVQNAHCRIPGIPGSWLTKCQKRYSVDMTTKNIYFQKPLEGREILILVGTT